MAAIKKDRGSEAALKAAQDAEAKLQAGASFDDVAKQLGVSSEPARFVGRTDSTIPAQLREVFNAPKPTAQPIYRAVALQTGGAAVVALTQLCTEAPVVDKDKQADQIKQQSMMARAGRPRVMGKAMRLRTLKRCAGPRTCARTPKPSSKRRQAALN